MAGKSPIPSAAIILAAGASRRLGQPKQLITWRGQPLLRHMASVTLGAPLWPVIVVLGAEAERIRPILCDLPVLIVENPAWSEGLAASLRCGLAALTEFSHRVPGAVLLTGDQPFLKADVLETLAAPAEADGITARATHYQGAIGVPAWFAAQHFGALQRLTGQSGAKAYLQGLPATALGIIRRPELATDIDTPDDYTKALARIHADQPQIDPN